MFIKDLPAPITASKADWLQGTTWLGFTPTGTGSDAAAKCQSTVQRQFGSGYVVEYITEQMNVPNPGFEKSPEYLSEIESHSKNAGRLIAVHRLRPTYRPLAQILGKKEYELMQDMWAQNGKRLRWSVAFPIIETFEIDERPKAKTVFGDESYHRLYAHSSATLRALTESEQEALSELRVTQIEAKNAWIGIADEVAIAERSDIPANVLKLISKDLSDKALEGQNEEQRVKLRRRAAWLANRFILKRRSENQLICDDCNFDPRNIFAPETVNPRSLLDVHHKNPLDEGERYTTLHDFALLCPTCHRVEHVRLRLAH